MIAGQIEIQLLAEMSRLKKDMDEAKRSVGGAMASIERSVDTAKQALGALGIGLSGGMFVAFTKGAINAADAVNDMTQRIGASIKDIAKYELATSQSGTTMEVLAKGIKGVAANLSEHGAELKKAGITATTADGAMRQFADVFAKMPDSLEKTNLSVKVFGKSGMDLIPMLNMGSAGLAEAAEKSEKYAATLAVLAPQADKFNDNVAELALSSKAVGMAIVNDAMPGLISISGGMAMAAQEAGLLKAAWVGLGGIGWEAIFKPAGVLIMGITNDLEELNVKLMRFFGQEKEAQKLEGQIAARWKEIASMTAGPAASQAAEPKKFDSKEALAEYKKLMEALGGTSDAAKAANKELAAQDKLIAELSGLTGSFAEDWAHLNKMYGAGKISLEHLTMAQANLLAKQPAIKKAHDEEIRQAKLLAEEWEDAAAAKAEYDKQYGEKLNRGLAIVNDYGKAIAENNKLTEFEIGLLGQTETARNIAIGQYRVRLDLEKEILRIDELGLDAADKRLLIEKARTAAAEASAGVTGRVHLDEWKKVNEQIGQSLTDEIMRGGKNAGELMKNYFKTLVLRPVIEGIVQPIAGSITSMLMGGSTGAGGGAGGTMNLLSMGKTLWDGFSSGGFSGMASSIGSMFGFGGGMGLTGASSIGGSASLASMGLAGGGMGAPIASTAAGAAAGGGGMMSGIGGMLSKIPVVGWILAGMMKSQGWHKQGWDANNGSIGTIGKIAGPATYADQLLKKMGLSGSTAALLSGSGIHSRIFGRKNPEVESFGVQGDFSSTGFAGNEFVNILRKGGWLRSDKRSQQTQAVNTDLQDTLDSGIQGLVAATRGFGSALGIEADVIDGYTKSIKLNLDRDATKSQELITGLFAEIADELAGRMVPTIADFAKGGETAAGTLQRIADNYAAVDTVLNAIGMTFGAVGLASVAARERLIEFAGGVDALAAGASFFSQNFLTEAERMAPVIKSVTEEMARLGYAWVDTKEEFKDLLLGLDLSSESSARLAVDLMRVQEGFAAAADYSRIMADETIANAQRQAAETSKLQEAAAQMQEAAAQTALDTAMRQVDTAFSALQRAVGAERNAITKSHQDAMTAINASIGTASATISKLSSLSNSLRSTIDRMRMPSEFGVDRAAAQAQIATALAIARTGGVLPQSDSLANALSVVSQPSEQLYSTFLDYQRDFLITRNNITDLTSITDVQLSIEEQTLAALNAQLEVAQTGYNAEMSRLDGILTAAQAQIDILNGIDSRLISVLEAQSRFGGSVAGAATAQANLANLTGTTAPAVTGLYANILGRTPDAEGAAWWQGVMANRDLPWSDVTTEFVRSAVATGGSDAERAIAYARENGIPGFAGGGWHMGGVRMVGEYGPEIEATGAARYYSASQTAAMMSGGTNDALLKELIDENKRLREIVESHLYAIAKNTLNTSDALTDAADGKRGLAVKTIEDEPLETEAV